MKHELGDKVRIKKHWSKQDREEQLEKIGITDIEKHLMSDDMTGDFVHIDKYKKEIIDEIGFICGIRIFKINYDLMYDFDDPYVKDGIRQIDYETEKVYLVATRMNGLRRVSFEDVELLEENVKIEVIQLFSGKKDVRKYLVVDMDDEQRGYFEQENEISSDAIDQILNYSKIYVNMNLLPEYIELGIKEDGTK